MHSSENSIEQSFRRWCKKRGLYRCKLKLNPGRGWPDQCILLRGNIVIWIEFKGPFGKLTPQQEFLHKKLREHGHEVHVCRSLESAVEIVEQIQEKCI